MPVWYFLAAASLVGLIASAVRRQTSFRVFVFFGLLLMLSAGEILLQYTIDCLRDRGVTNHYSVSMTVDQARAAGCPIPLPREAKNVRFGSVASVDRTENYVKFEAPVEVCRAQVKEVIRTKEGMSPILAPLLGRPETMQSQLTNADWFDVQNIVHGETASFDNILGRVWIDTDRGIFYFYQDRH